MDLAGETAVNSFFIEVCVGILSASMIALTSDVCVKEKFSMHKTLPYREDGGDGKDGLVTTPANMWLVS